MEGSQNAAASRKGTRGRMRGRGSGGTAGGWSGESVGEGRLPPLMGRGGGLGVAL